jgi:sensor histidine kinase regulating citrate/malate metabolism
MDGAVSPLYLLERFDVGVIELDAARNVTAMNDFASRVLPVAEKQPFGRRVLSFHPERSQPKVEGGHGRGPALLQPGHRRPRRPARPRALHARAP